MFCPTCGSERPDPDNFCAACGAALRGTPTATPGPRSESHVAALVGSEHIGLRDEIIKRIELQVQLISITLVAAGAFLTIGLQRGQDAAGGQYAVAALLVYPLLALFTWATWAFHQLRIIEAAAYIKRLEDKRPDCFGWETFLREVRGKHFLSQYLPFLTFGGLWISSQVLVLFIALLLANSRPGPALVEGQVEQVLVVLDLLAIMVTIILLFMFSIPRFRRNVIDVE
jgi:hypothetical protein